MTVAVVLEYRFLQLPDGSIWTDSVFAPQFWSRYSPPFSDVLIVARAQSVAAVPTGATRVDNGVAVKVFPVQDYVGLMGLLRSHRTVKRQVQQAVSGAPSVLIRAPSILGVYAAGVRLRQGVPFALEVVGDPATVFAPGASRHPLRPLVRYITTRQLRRLCRQAAGVAYVTRTVLQRRYPAGPVAFTGSYSSVELLPTAFRAARQQTSPDRPMLMVTVASLAQPYKGVDTLIVALGRLRREGLEAELDVIGSGRLLNDYIDLARRERVEDHVTFHGQVPGGSPVRDLLNRADLFVLASRTEGLPRSLLEAMALSLPCVGTAVGGIPELLMRSALVPPGDPAELAVKLRVAWSNVRWRERQSQRNFKVAWTYREETVEVERQRFYAQVHRLSANL